MPGERLWSHFEHFGVCVGLLVRLRESKGNQFRLLNEMWSRNGRLWRHWCPPWAFWSDLLLPGRAKREPEVFKTRFWGHVKTIDFLGVFCVFSRLWGPPGDPNDGLEAVSSPTWSSRGTLLKHLWSIMAHSVALECQGCSLFRGGGGWRWVKVG